MNRNKQIKLIEKAIEGIKAGDRFRERRDIFPKNEHWSSAEQLLIGRIESNLLPLLKLVTGGTCYDLLVAPTLLTFTCHWASGDEAGEFEVERTDNHFEDIGRAALCAILLALIADLKAADESIAVYGRTL